MSKPNDMVRHIGGSQDKGINTFDPDIGAEITWDESTVNVSGGIRRGAGPRYGVAPLVGHADTESTTGTRTNGITAAEGATGQGLRDRKLIFSIVPFSMVPYDGTWPKQNRQSYAYIVGLDDGSGGYTLDVCLGSTLSGSIYKQSPDIRAGLMDSSYKGESPLVRKHKTELINLPTTSTPTADDVASILSFPDGRFWTPTANISISGKRVPYHWLLADNLTVPNATTSPRLNLWEIPAIVALNPNILGGSPSEIITRENQDDAERTVQLFCLSGALGYLDLKYENTITNLDTHPALEYSITTANYDEISPTIKTGASTAYGSVGAVLLNDPGSYTNTKHHAILVAGEKPLAVIYRDWLQAESGMKPQWIDLSNPTAIPRDSLSYYRGTADELESRGSAFFNSNANPAIFVETGAGNGIFRTGIEYQLGVSFYNKTIDYETNVVFGTAFKPTADFTGICIHNVGGTNCFSEMHGSGTHVPPWEHSESKVYFNGETPRGFHINDYEIRFYYKVTGSAEWLPAGFFDAAKYWFFPEFPSFSGGSIQGPTVGQSPVAGTPGGQAGAFVDYSPLPKQRYICTVTFNNRAFWFSEKSAHFSLSGNIYAYPTRNIFNVPSGTVRGGIVHIQDGETEHEARLVIFASDQTYVSRFTGLKLKQQVRVSATTVGQFDVDGSDFTIDNLTDGTAYSYRAAVVAEGDLYWWGSKGVYFDDGRSKPRKISGLLEDEIFDYVDTSRIGEIHAIYNTRTSEVIWFYPPKVPDADYPTHGLAYNVESGKFYPMKFRCQIDSAQNIQIEDDDSPSGISGERVLIHARATSAATVQRTFFLDQLCKSGEQGPTRELLVKDVSTPADPTSRVLGLAAGHLDLSTISVNDFLAFQNVNGYSDATLGNDFIAKILAVDVGASEITIAMPTGASLSDAALVGPNFFPAYHRGALDAGNHGITYQIQTNYWLPGGVDVAWLWQYIYMMFKYTPWPAPTVNQLALAYRTLVCGGFIVDNLTLTDNSDGNCQIFHQLRNTESAALGQALKYRFAGVHIGHQWTLEYLEAHCVPDKGYTLKEFEG